MYYTNEDQANKFDKKTSESQKYFIKKSVFFTYSL